MDSVGLDNGDVVHAVNGLPTYNTARPHITRLDDDHIVVDLTPRGVRTALGIEVQG